MAAIEQISEALFEKIRSRFESVSVGDELADATQDPAKARYFNFDYSSAAGEKFGNVTISLIDDNCLKIYFGKNLSAELSPAEKTEWYDFLRDMRMFAKRNMLTFDTRDISRSNLSIKDIKQSSHSDGAYTSSDVNMAESKMYGSKKTSFESITPGVRLRIRHNGMINADIHGARTRKIDSVFVETDEGERLKCPSNNLAGCRAYARHVSSGGKMNDDFGNHITSLVTEMGKIKQFVRASHNKVYENGEANDIASAAKERFTQIHKILSSLKGPRGSKMYKEQWIPESETDDGDLDSLKEKFIMKNFDDRLSDGLPYAAKAYRSRKNTTESQLDEFAKWTDNVTEGTWALPKDDQSMQALQDIMSDRLEAGIDGNNATAALYDIVGDDMLFDLIYDASKGSPEMDVRPVVLTWLERNLPDAAEKVKTNMEAGQQEQSPEETEPEPEQDMPEPEQDMPEPEQNTQDPAQKMQHPMQGNESGDPLSVMRRLAGLSKK